MCKQTIKPNTLIQKKQAISLFEDERCNKITFKRPDYVFFATYSEISNFSFQSKQSQTV